MRDVISPTKPVFTPCQGALGCSRRSAIAMWDPSSPNTAGRPTIRSRTRSHSPSAIIDILAPPRLTAPSVATFLSRLDRPIHSHRTVAVLPRPPSLQPVQGLGNVGERTLCCCPASGGWLPMPRYRDGPFVAKTVLLGVLSLLRSRTEQHSPLADGWKWHL